MTQKTTNEKKLVRVQCAQIVKDYTFAKLQELGGGINCSSLHSMLQQYGGVLSKTRKQAVTDIDELLKQVDAFYPAVLMTQADADKTRQFIAAWKMELKQKRKDMQGALKPIYLNDEVTKELQHRGSKLRCTDTMLEHCLSHLGIHDVTPEKICDVVMKYAATDWSKLTKLARSASLTFRLDTGSEKEKEIAKKHVLWLYRLEGDGGIDNTILDALGNDMKVMADFNHWRKSEPETCEYISKYKEFVKVLKTPSHETLAAFLGGDVPAVGDDADKQHQDVTQKTEEDDTTSTGGSDNQDGNTVTDETPSEGVGDAGTTATDAEYGEVTESEQDVSQGNEPTDEPTALETVLMRQRDGVTLTADDQKILLQNKICPVCGSEMIERNGINGKYMYCPKLHYKADGTFDAPVIHNQFLDGVTPTHPLPSSQG